MVSTQWRVTVESEHASAAPASIPEALALAAGLDRGEVGGTGVGGDCVQLQFNAQHALVLYMTPEQAILRPAFRSRDTTGAGVERFFCACCGVQLGDRAELLVQCTTRAEGFALCAEILDGRLPASDELEWVPLRAAREHE